VTLPSGSYPITESVYEPGSLGAVVEVVKEPSLEVVTVPTAPPGSKLRVNWRLALK